jgi:acyl-CoA reductase-like NAD-dependent aldehyde dehydrogenase
MTLEVRKTYKLFIGGKFPRSESGRSFAFNSPNGEFLANVAHASRKDLRDAVVAARAAAASWSGATAYNRGQVLYRIAEMLDARADQFAAEIGRETRASAKQARRQLEQAVTSLVWHAGWSDKIDSVAGSLNPVAGPFFNITSYQPSGVIGIIPRESDGFVGLITAIAAAVVSGNTAVVLASVNQPLSALTLGEVFATSDLPGGVVNLLTGPQAELASWLAGHEDVNALDLSGAMDAVPLIESAAQTLKRIIRPDSELASGQSLERILVLMEAKTVWHPKGY